MTKLYQVLRGQSRTVMVIGTDAVPATEHSVNEDAGYFEIFEARIVRMQPGVNKNQAIR